MNRTEKLIFFAMFIILANVIGPDGDLDTVSIVCRIIALFMGVLFGVGWIFDNRE